MAEPTPFPRPIDLSAPSPGDGVTGQALPANIAAEAAFLGAVLIDNRVMEELNTPLAPTHFHEPVHARIFERVMQLLDRKAVVTPVTLRPYFEADEALRELGGTAYLARLTADGQGLLAPRVLAEQIYDLALLRELVSVGRNLVTAAMDTSESGSIEQDADMVWFIYRPEYYLREPDQPTATAPQAVHDAHAKWQESMERVYGLAELIIGKQRHGSIGTVRLKFEAKITKFSDLANDDMAQDGYD